MANALEKRILDASYFPVRRHTELLRTYVLVMLLLQTLGVSEWILKLTFLSSCLDTENTKNT